ncbi:MAG TPA: glycogen debranching N-terminal domain-containing protein, partial [Myxococcota bacterium]
MSERLPVVDPDNDVIRVADRYYVLATSSPLDDRLFVLKDGDTFAIFDRRGDIRPLGPSTQGVYTHDMRYLSRCGLLVAGARPLVLSSSVGAAGALLTVDLTNPDLPGIANGALHIRRTILLRHRRLRQRVTLTSYAPTDLDVEVVFDIDADYAD